MATRVVVLGEDAAERARVLRLLERSRSVRVAEVGDAVVWLGGPVDFAAAPVVALVEDEAQAAEMLARGAAAVLPRHRLDRLEAAVAAALAGLVALEPSLASALARAPRPEAAGESLTAREQDVLELLGEALSNKEIGVRLGISEHTVKFHVNTIYRKLGVESRTEAVVRAARLGLLTI